VSSIQEIVKKTINECDNDIRGELLHNVITSGGSSNFVNFGTRLQQELSEIHASESIKIEEKEHREFLPWLGGSMLSSLSTFQNMWVSKQEYAENGSGIIDKKCF
jgi:actin-related protein